MRRTHTHIYIHIYIYDISIRSVADHWHSAGWLVQLAIQPFTETKPQNKVRTFPICNAEIQLNIKFSAHINIIQTLGILLKCNLNE
jgi:hypothetical protein